MADNIHDVQIDPRNLNILISVNGKLTPRAEAMVSVFDSGFILGDGVWEGLRMVKGGVPFLREHIERLYEGAKAIFMDIGLAPDELVKRLFDCLDANRMEDGVHIRLMVTRGVKATPYQDPRVTIGKPTIVIIPEYKTPNPEKMAKGLSLHTVNVRRGYPDVQDQKLNSHSKLNCITACIQAANAGADAQPFDPRSDVRISGELVQLAQHQRVHDHVDDGVGAEDVVLTGKARLDLIEARRLAVGGVGGSLPSYIGPLPPGPAPPDGDWFTRLQAASAAKE